MKRVKVYTNYNEWYNSYGYHYFDEYPEIPRVGDLCRIDLSETIMKVESVQPDIRSLEILDKYSLYYIQTTYNGEYDFDNDEYLEKYVAVPKDN